VSENGTILDPLRPPRSQDWGFATPKTSIDIISGTGKAMDFNFGRYIQRVDPNKTPFKILVKRERWRIHPRDCPNFWIPLLSPERAKLRISNSVRTFTGSIETKAHEKFGKSSRGRTQGLSKIFGAPYIGRIARSSLR